MNQNASTIISPKLLPPDLEVPIRVQYYETDRMGVVHHANYPRYFETARMEQFRRWGCPYEKIEEAGCFLVITNMECQCRAPARFGDLIRVRVRVTRMTNHRIFHDYTIVDQEGMILTRGKTRLAAVEENGRPADLMPLLQGIRPDQP